MKKSVFLAFGLSFCAAAQTSFIVSGPKAAAASDTVQLSITVPDANIAALQWVFSFPASIPVTLTAGSSATAAGKALSCNPSGRFCLLYGVNATVIPAGPVAVYTFTIPASQPAGQIPMPLSSLLAFAPDGSEIPLVGASAGIAVVAKQDLNGDGKVDNLDVQLMVGEAVKAEGGACTLDQNGDGKCDLADVMIVLLKSRGV